MSYFQKCCKFRVYIRINNVVLSEILQEPGQNGFIRIPLWTIEFLCTMFLYFARAAVGCTSTRYQLLRQTSIVSEIQCLRRSSREAHNFQNKLQKSKIIGKKRKSSFQEHDDHEVATRSRGTLDLPRSGVPVNATQCAHANLKALQCQRR